VCCVSAFLTKDKLRLLKRLMMNLAAAAPARGVLLMQPVGEVREAFSTWIFTARDFLMHQILDGESKEWLHSYLESSHITRVSCVFQAVLVALQEELEEESVTQEKIYV
jgi:hypothetical protein